MALEKIVGPLSDVYLKSKPKKDSQGNVTGKEYTWVLRIGNRQAFLKDAGKNAVFSDGDEAIAVGKFSFDGSFKIWAIRNETSGTLYKSGDGSSFSFPPNSSIGNYIFSVVILIFFGDAFRKGGEPSVQIMALLLTFGFIWYGYQWSKVKKMLLEHTD